MNKTEMSDRRSGAERRTSKRYSVNVDAEWEHSSGRHTGTVSDISENGCFVLSSGDVNDGDAVKLFLPMGDGMKVQFEGEIKNHVYEIGFAVKFINMSDAQRGVLANFLEGKTEV
jgi:hypothetical protein